MADTMVTEVPPVTKGTMVTEVPPVTKGTMDIKVTKVPPVTKGTMDIKVTEVLMEHGTGRCARSSAGSSTRPGRDRPSPWRPVLDCRRAPPFRPPQLAEIELA
jgi:hypothetical protein